MAITEKDLEQLCIQWLQSLGYQYLHGETLSPGGSTPERAKIRGHYPGWAVGNGTIRRYLRSPSTMPYAA